MSDVLRLSRRLLLAPLGYAVGCVLPKPSFPARYDTNESLATVSAVPDEVSRVIVIGAGISGLTVANALAAAGKTVRVLEARTRLGGRLHSAKVGRSNLDLGAAWIHEPNRNPLTRFTQTLGVTSSPFPISTLITDGEFWESGTGFVGGLDKLRVLRALDSLDYPKLIARASSHDIQSVLDDALAPWRSDTVMHARMLGVVQTVLQTENAAPLSGQSDQMLTFTPPYDGGDDLMDGHYQSLATMLANGVEVLLEQPVSEVRWSEAGVEVVRADGFIEHASHVVVTVPLGVLKAGVIEFTPALPSEKQSAIERLGFGRFEKLALEFDEKFWSRGGAAVVVNGPGSETVPLFLDVTSHASAPTLVSLCAGPAGEQFSKTSPDQRVEIAMSLLRQAFGSDIPSPRATASTEWTTDEWARGSYVVLAPGATLDDFDALAAPIANRVLFAGEATSRVRFATVDGAFSSGVREAQRLLGVRTVQLMVGAPPA